MITVIEKKKQNLSYYIVRKEEVDGTISERIVNLKTVITDKKYLLYASDGTLIEDAYRYFNNRIYQLSDNYTRNCFYAVRYLYSFGEIIEKDIRDFEYKDFVALLNFLIGNDGMGSEYSFELLKNKATRSVKNQYAFLLDYYDGIGLRNSPIHTRLNIIDYLPRSAKAAANVTREKPPYVSYDEYLRLIEVIKNIPDPELALRNKIIVRLMYIDAFRIGEVLGLTLEDVGPFQKENGDIIGSIIIRNRLSDDPKSQSAKCVMKVRSEKDYVSSDYHTKDVGYQIGGCPRKTLDMIEEYIDTYHPMHKKNHRENYEKAKADAVDGYKKKKKQNYYIFLNKDGRPLKQSGMNKALRKLYEEAGIPVDYGTKRCNVAHRLRHGAVVRMIEMGIPFNDIMKKTRHKNPESLMVYTERTSREVIEMTDNLYAEAGLESTT